MSNSKHHGHHSSRSTGKTILCSLFAFILSLALTAIGLGLLVHVDTSENMVSRAFDENYASYVKQYLDDTASDYTQPTFIDTRVLDGLFTTEQIYKDTVLTVAAAYRGESYTPDTDAAAKQLSANVESFFEEEGLSEEPDVPEVISAYVSEIMEFYANAFQVKGLSSVVSIHNLIDKYLWIGLAGAGVLAILMIFLCIRLHHFAHRGLRYVAYATGGAFLMTLAAPLVLYLSRLYERLQVTPQYFYDCLTKYLKQVLESFFVASAAWLVITVVLVIVIKLLRNHVLRSED